MKNLTLVSALSAFALLSACSSGGDSAASGGDAATMQAGEYEMSMKIVEAEIPGMPENGLETMQTMLPQGIKSCILEDQIKDGMWDNVTGDMKQGMENCEVLKEDNSANALDMQLKCKTPQGDAMLTMKGKTTEDSMTVNMTNDMEAQGQKVHIVMEMSGKRVGDCSEETRKAAEDKAAASKAAAAK